MNSSIFDISLCMTRSNLLSGCFWGTRYYCRPLDFFLRCNWGYYLSGLSSIWRPAVATVSSWFELDDIRAVWASILVDAPIAPRGTIFSQSIRIGRTAVTIKRKLLKLTLAYSDHSCYPCIIQLPSFYGATTQTKATQTKNETSFEISQLQVEI